MKSTTSGFSQLTVSLSFATVLLMLTGSMAAPVQTSIGQAPVIPSPSIMKSFIYSSSLELSKIVGETLTDFAKDRLGDKNYDEYIARIPGLPLPSWHLDRMTEQALLNKTVEELYLFRKFIDGMRTHESQNKSSQFTAKFQEIEYHIDGLMNLIQNVQLVLGYTATQPSGLLQPTLKPTASQKEQDELQLGALKEFLRWLVPVEAEFHPETTA